MAEYDLFPRFVSYLDPQIAFALLEYVGGRQIYDAKDIARAQIELVHHTNMVEFEESIYSEQLQEDPPQELAQRKQAVISKLNQASKNAEPLTQLLSNDETIAQLGQDRSQNIATLKSQFGIGPEQIDALFKYGKELYECGAYAPALDMLDNFSQYCLDAGRIVSADWGKLACHILMQQWGPAIETIDRLKEEIDAHLFSDPLKQLQSRTWLLHWAGFAFWSTADGPARLLDTMLQDRFAVAVQLNAPHLLRYMVAAHLVIKGKSETQGIKWQVQLDQLRRILVSEEYQYSDPVTDFVKAVYVDYDFARAQERLAACDALLANDYFLQNVKATFQENARMAVFEVYCRIHQCINLSALAAQMGMGRDEAEGWIAQLIKSTKLDARIDSSAGNMVMGTHDVDPLDAIVDRTNNLSTRTFKIANAIVDGMQPAKAAA